MYVQIEYPPFRKAFYTEVPELAKMSDADVVAMRKEMDGIKAGGAGGGTRTTGHSGTSAQLNCTCHKR